MRRTSVYTLSFTTAPGAAPRHLELTVNRLGMYRTAELVGSGTEPHPYVMFRLATSDAEAVALAKLLCFTSQGAARFKSANLTTGQGTHTRTINLEGTDMTTKTTTTYDVLLQDGTGCGSRARKDAAIKLGDLQGQPFTVVSQPSGKVVHDSTLAENGEELPAEEPTPTPAEAPAPAKTTKAKAPAKATTKKEKPVATKTATKTKAPAKAAPAPETTEEEAPGTELEFFGAAKAYVKSLGLHGAQAVGKVYGVTASLRGNVVTLRGEDEDVEQVVAQLEALWPATKAPFRAWKKADAEYAPLDKSQANKPVAAQRYEMENAYFIAFMDGAAAELAGAAKKKGGAYKDGVLAVREPAPADDNDVI